MNKKILSIFVMVMALSLLGVSCNNKSTDPNNENKVTVNPEDVKAINNALNGLTIVQVSDSTAGTSDVSGQKFDFATAIAAESEKTSHEITGVAGGTAAGKAKASELGNYIKTQLSSSSINVTYNAPTGTDPLVVTAKKGTATVTVTINPLEAQGWATE